jgi:LysR family hca operon transcriptional activator
LTEAGRVFLGEARLVIEQATRTLERTRLAAQPSTGTLGVGFVPGVEVEELQHVMEALEGSWQQAQIIMRSQSSPVLIASLHDRLLDVAFVRPSSQCEGLALRTIRRERLIVAVPAGHRFAGRSSLDIEDLVGEPLIDVTSHHAPVLFDTIQTFAASKHVTFTPTYQAENLMMALSLISTMGGIGLLPERSRRLFPASVTTISISGEVPTIELALAWHPENKSPLVIEFVSRFNHVI